MIAEGCVLSMLKTIETSVIGIRSRIGRGSKISTSTYMIGCKYVSRN